jgi:hypothetical protein
VANGKNWRIPPSDHRGNDTSLTVSRDNSRLPPPGREPAGLPAFVRPRSPPGRGERLPRSGCEEGPRRPRSRPRPARLMILQTPGSPCGPPVQGRVGALRVQSFPGGSAKPAPPRQLVNPAEARELARLDSGPHRRRQLQPSAAPGAPAGPLCQRRAGFLQYVERISTQRRVAPGVTTCGC